MSRTDDLLLLESAGQLPADMQKDLDTLRSAGVVPQKAGAAPSSKPVSGGLSTQDDYTIEAKTGSEARPTGIVNTFTDKLGKEFSGGISDIGDSIHSRMGPMGVGIQAALGLGRALSSPVTAGGEAVGEGVGEAVRSSTQDYLGVNGSSAAGATLGAMANMATQFLAVPFAIAKAAPRLMQATQSAVSHLPGAQVTLRDLAKKAVEAFPAKMAPTRPSRELYDELSGMNPMLNVPEFRSIAAAINKKESALAEFGLGSGAGGVAGKIEAATGNGPLPFNVVQSVRQRIGARIGELRQTGGEALGEYKQLYKGISQSLENAAEQGTGEAFTLLKHANKAANREFSLQEFDDMVNKTMGRALEGQEFTSSNFAKLLNSVRDAKRKDPLFAKGLGDANLKTIEDNLEQAAKLRINPPPKNVNVGSALRVARGSAGAMVGNYIGGPTGAIYGGGIAMIAPEIMSRIVQSKAGTQMLTDVLKAGGTITPTTVAGIMAVIRGEQAVSDGLPGVVKKSLQSKDVSIDEKIEGVNLKDTIDRSAADAASAIKRSLGMDQ